MPKGYNVTMSKKRYNEIVKSLHDILQDDQLVTTIETRIKEVMNYDPTAPSYNPEYGKQQVEQRQQRATKENKSIYEIYRKPYLKKKDT